MGSVYVCTLALSFRMLVAPALNAQDDASRVVAGGGISVPQWTGKIDASEARAGRNLNDAKLTKTGDTFHVITGPAAEWPPSAPSPASRICDPRELSARRHFLPHTEAGIEYETVRVK
jgi:hypothetical protein